ncbi:type IV secretory system conjugative DNA transfer family protein [Afipia clevelandensis]|uniref:Type IV secretion system protein VirD4 n=1 Tax=Afipia clevelandensis ATCC 49720 TaxID=883079 RepID=K8PAJ0_9BRAD|nr:type IV secretory system conjugative DNA transfer family protein [Afipia clevelandensis]EKS35363.1 hypothetical protein HMPREF9696_02635 [Afipia clevelandensis ATCC 49720]
MRRQLLLANVSGLPVTHEPPNMQLGTADWHRGGGRAFGPFKSGDFWLGRSETGELIGLRDDRHVLLTCGTRGGKGVSFIIPNLCMWPGSAVVIDPKGENAVVTARRRAFGSEYCDGLGQTVRLLDPFNETRLPASNHASFNPLDALDPNDEESVDEAARIAEALVISENSNDPFFDESARAFLKATILHVRTWPAFPDANRNLITVRKLIMAGDAEAADLAALNGDRRSTSGFALLFDAMKRNRAMSGVISRAGEMLAHMEEASPRLFGSVAQVARTNTDFLDSPAMARVLASSVFKLSELKTNPRGTSLYITLPQRYMETHFRWLRMMTTLVVTEMERVEMQPACGHPVLMLLDEFPALKRMRVLENAAAQIAGFGVKLVFVTQTLAQLKDLYKDNWETLVANAGVKLFFCNDDNFTREYISRSIGEREIVRNVASISESLGSSQSNSTSVNSGSSVSFSHTGNNLSSGITVGRSTGASQSVTDGSSFSQTRGISQTLHKRALITPDEVGRLFGNPESMRAIALVSGYQPMALVRTPYFREFALSACYDKHRAHSAPPPKQVIWRVREEQKEKEALAEFTAQRKAENDRMVHNNRIRDRVVAQQREAFIARCVRIGVAAVVAPPLCIGLWGFVAMLLR